MVQTGDRGRPFGRGGHPACGMRSLVRLRRHHPPGELEGGTVPFEVFLAPHGTDDLDRFGPLRPRLLTIDMERGLLHRRRSARAPFDPSLREDVGSGDLFGHSSRMREAIRQQCYTEPQPQVLGGLCQGSEYDFRRRAMRTTLAKVMFDEPRDVEPELIRELHLIEHLVIRALLSRSLPGRMLTGVPRSRCIDFIEQIELHLEPSGPRTVRCGGILTNRAKTRRPSALRGRYVTTEIDSWRAARDASGEVAWSKASHSAAY